MRRLPLPIIWIYSMMMSFARKVTFYNMDAPIANEFINDNHGSSYEFKVQISTVQFTNVFLT